MATLTLGGSGSGYTTPTKYALAALEERSRAIARHRSSIGGQHAAETKREHLRDLVQEIEDVKHTFKLSTKKAAVTHYLQCEAAWQTNTDAERRRAVNALLRRLSPSRKKV